ncbi:MAG: GNAT family N-acetyltransferase [Candidatus Lokiarchaeota archaeon]|nr:GNAT family N-acetyltransferase [Candidatus Lokiarchaeota archaeon]
MNWYKCTQLELNFKNLHIDYHNDQHDFIFYAKDKSNNKIIGGIEYSIFENEIYINWIKVIPEYRRMGVATQLYNKLKDYNRGLKINYGWATPSGKAWLNSLFKKEMGR